MWLIIVSLFYGYSIAYIHGYASNNYPLTAEIYNKDDEVKKLNHKGFSLYYLGFSFAYYDDLMKYFILLICYSRVFLLVVFFIGLTKVLMQLRTIIHSVQFRLFKTFDVVVVSCLFAYV